MMYLFHRSLPILLLGCSSLIGLPVHASNFGFMKNSLVSELSSADFQQLNQRAVTILEQTPDKKVTRWQAPDSGVTVKILPKLRYREAGNECRRTLFNFSKPQRSAETYGFNICKNAEGKWQVTQSRLQNLHYSDIKLIEDHVQQALGEKNIGVPITWFNPKTNINGTLVLIESLQHNRLPCYKIALSLFDTGGVSLEGQYLLCHTEKGWQRLGD
ncbi:hypothetical protein [Cellvibrio japonicus]|nr:hypothetical protein [Cellvibrio japonicus]QEI11889.1 hypothetical protein FY117_06360 [Cellvibrio japonicus]QEI15463.1 hypothetical protein FY116_06360 [Cellvibrio japonicus]QEI19042.1 hypothetical protein FY115_06360 [Cellvibrio japonicus]